MQPTIAIVGRPNVGKSTLFNRLVGRRLALVDDTPGVTRDRREGEATLGDLSFRVIDTAGFEEVPRPGLEGRMRAQTEAAIRDADAVLMLVDARTGITPADHAFADIVRRAGKPVILVANKSESKRGFEAAFEAYTLGIGDPVAISAEHGEGLSDLYAAIRETLPASEEAAEPVGDKPIQVAIVGRPNAGKSTLVNKLLGEERLLTGPEPGITRDTITVRLQWRGRAFELFDTAGLRRRARIVEKLEKLSAADALRAIRFAEVVVLLIDSERPFEEQDLRLADLVIEEGRALVLAISKSDLAAAKAIAPEAFAHRGRPLAAAGQGHAGRAGVGPDRRGARPPARRGRQNPRGVEPPRADRGAQPFPRRRDRGQCAARGFRRAHQAALHDAAQGAAAELRPVRHAHRRAA